MAFLYECLLCPLIVSIHWFEQETNLVVNLDIFSKNIKHLFFTIAFYGRMCTMVIFPCQEESGKLSFLFKITEEYQKLKVSAVSFLKMCTLQFQS